VETLGRLVLKYRRSVVTAFNQQVYRLRTQQGRIKPIELNRAATALSVADFSGEDCFLGGTAAPIILKVAVGDHANHTIAQRVGRTCEHHIAAGIRGSVFRKFISLFVHYSFAANDHHIFLQVVQILHAIHKPIDIDGVLRYQNDVGLPVCCPQSDISGMASHHFDNGDSAMAFRRGADAIHTL
jgi:hypothetical protein